MHCEKGCNRQTVKLKGTDFGFGVQYPGGPQLYLLSFCIAAHVLEVCAALTQASEIFNLSSTEEADLLSFSATERAELFKTSAFRFPLSADSAGLVARPCQGSWATNED